MADRICLDTTVLVDLLRNKSETVEWMKTAEKTSLLTTTFINAFELFTGAFLSQAKDKNIRATEALLQRLRLLTLSHESARRAGECYALLQKEGNIVEIRDILIGSIALAEGCSIKTRNVKHFTRISGIVVE